MKGPVSRKAADGNQLKCLPCAKRVGEPRWLMPKRKWPYPEPVFVRSGLQKRVRATTGGSDKRPRVESWRCAFVSLPLEEQQSRARRWIPMGEVNVNTDYDRFFHCIGAM